MKTVTVNLGNDMIQLIDGIIQHEIFPNRSECIRAAIRNLLLYQQKLISQLPFPGIIIAFILIFYNIGRLKD